MCSTFCSLGCRGVADPTAMDFPALLHILLIDLNMHLSGCQEGSECLLGFAVAAEWQLHFKQLLWVLAGVKTVTSTCQ